MKSIPVMIIDHQEASRFGLSQWIKETQDLKVVASTGCVKEATVLLNSIQPRPEVIVFDPQACVQAGLSLDWLTQHLYPNTVTRLLCWHADSDSDLIPVMLQFGADGVLLKDEPLRVIAKSIRKIHQGDLPCYSKPVMKKFAIEPRNREKDGLTKREREVLQLLSEGLNNQQISTRLNLALSTVKNCVSGIYKKIKTRNRAEAAAWAIKTRILSG